MSDLFSALLSGDNDLLESELQKDPKSVSEATPWGVTLLIMAVKSNNSNAVSTLLRAGADVDQPARIKSRTSGRIHADATALMFCESKEIANILLQAGADPGFKDAKGWTAFMHVARTLDKGLVSCILSSGYVPSEADHRKYVAFLNDEINFRRSTSGADGDRLEKLVEYADWYKNMVLK